MNDKQMSLKTSMSQKTTQPISELVKGPMTHLMVSGIIPPEEIARLEDRQYCKDTFSISFPVLKRLSPDDNPSFAAKDSNSHGRYCVRPVFISGTGYLVCSQWYERNREALELWLDGHENSRP